MPPTPWKEGKQMSRTQLASVLGILLLLGLAAAGSAEGIPDQLQNVENPNGPPVWLSESALKQAMDKENQPEGSRLESVRERLLGYLVRGRLDWSLDPGEFEVAPDGTLICEPNSLTRRLKYYKDEVATDVAGLVKLSTAILSVRVVGSKPGFVHSRAGELIEVEVLSVLKDIEPGAMDPLGPAPPAPVDGFYLWDWYARMVIDGRAVCLGTRQVPRGDFILFLRYTRSPSLASLPIFSLDGAALVAADGSSHGTLLDRYNSDPQELARQLEQIFPGKP